MEHGTVVVGWERQKQGEDGWHTAEGQDTMVAGRWTQQQRVVEDTAVEWDAADTAAAEETGWEPAD